MNNKDELRGVLNKTHLVIILLIFYQSPLRYSLFLNKTLKNKMGF